MEELIQFFILNLHCTLKYKQKKIQTQGFEEIFEIKSIQNECNRVDNCKLDNDQMNSIRFKRH